MHSLQIRLVIDIATPGVLPVAYTEFDYSAGKSVDSYNYLVISIALMKNTINKTLNCTCTKDVLFYYLNRIKFVSVKTKIYINKQCPHPSTSPAPR